MFGCGGASKETLAGFWGVAAGGGLATGAGFSLHWKIGLGALGTTMAALIVQWSRIELARRKGEDPF